MRGCLRCPPGVLEAFPERGTVRIQREPGGVRVLDGGRQGLLGGGHRGIDLAEHLVNRGAFGQDAGAPVPVPGCGQPPSPASSTRNSSRAGMPVRNRALATQHQ